MIYHLDLDLMIWISISISISIWGAQRDEQLDEGGRRQRRVSLGCPLPRRQRRVPLVECRYRACRER